LSSKQIWSQFFKFGYGTLGPPPETQGNKYLMRVHINNYNQTMKKMPVQISSLLSFFPQLQLEAQKCVHYFLIQWKLLDFVQESDELAVSVYKCLIESIPRCGIICDNLAHFLLLMQMRIVEGEICVPAFTE
jgi:hypothetical protein